MNITQHEVKTASTTGAQVVNFTDVPGGACTFYFIVVTGTLKIGTSEAAAALSKAYSSSDVIPPMSGTNGQIYVIANSDIDTFLGTAIPLR